MCELIFLVIVFLTTAFYILGILGCVWLLMEILR